MSLLTVVLMFAPGLIGLTRTQKDIEPLEAQITVTTTPLFIYRCTIPPTNSGHIQKRIQTYIQPVS